LTKGRTTTTMPCPSPVPIR